MWALLSVPRLESRSREKEGFFVLRAVVSRAQKTNGLFSEREKENERELACKYSDALGNQTAAK